MTRFVDERENEDGWTDWIEPLPDYKLACCDCGLVHRLEFRVNEEGNVEFRASRDARATGQRRRWLRKQ